MSPQMSKRSRVGVAVAGVGVAALAVAGVAYAATNSDPASAGGSAAATAEGGADGTADGRFDPGGPDPVRDDEQSVDADTAESLTAAAQAEVPGATIIRVETDGDGAAYEVHLTTADGTLQTVTFDENLAVVEVHDGMGPGGRDGAGHGRGDDRGGHDDSDDGSSDDAQSSSSDA